MVSQQFSKWISGSDEIDWDKFILELKFMAYSSSRRVGRSLGDSEIQEVISMFTEFLWDNSYRRPLTDEECFSKLKRFVYAVSSPGRDFVGYDEQIATTIYNPTTKDSREDTSVFYRDIDKMAIPKSIKSLYVNIVDSSEYLTLLELARENNSFLSKMLMAFILRKAEVGSAPIISPIPEEHEHIYLASLVVKFHDFWPLYSYVMWGSSFLSSFGVMMSSVVRPELDMYFKKLWESIQVYLGVERYLLSCDLDQAYKEASWVYSLRLRDVIRRHNRIKVVLARYSDICEVGKQELKVVCQNLKRVDINQMTFGFGG